MYLKPARGVALKPFQEGAAGEVTRPVRVLAVGVREEIVGFYGPSQPFLVLGVRVQGGVGVKHVDEGAGLIEQMRKKEEEKSREGGGRRHEYMSRTTRVHTNLDAIAQKKEQF